MNEIWKPVVDFEGIYEVSNLGRVRTNTNLPRYRNGIKKLVTAGRGYLYTSLNKDNKQRKIAVHLLVAAAFLGHSTDGTTNLVVDHIDDDKTNNRLSNLQILTNRENISKQKRGTSQYTGVYWNKRASKWRSHIKLNKKQYHLGYFDTEEEAGQAYLNALKKYKDEDSRGD